LFQATSGLIVVTFYSHFKHFTALFSFGNP
jgi:hypothetical protein